MVVLRGASNEFVLPMDTITGSGDAGGVIESAEALGRAAEDVLGQVRKTLDDATVGSVRASASELQTLLEQLRGIATVQRDHLATLTASLGRSAEGLEAAGPSLERVISRSDSTLASIDRASATLERTLGSLGTILDRVEAGEGTLGKLSQDDSLYLSLTRTVSSLGELAEDLKANPRKYFNLEIF